MMSFKEWEAIKDQFIGTMNYFKVIGPMYITDGVKAMCDNLECYWIISELYTYKPLVFEQGLVTVKITSKDSKAKIRVEDGNYNVLATKDIDYTDLPEGEYDIWMQPSQVDSKDIVVCMLPSEY